jgi:hypothetical protein
MFTLFTACFPVISLKRSLVSGVCIAVVKMGATNLQYRKCLKEIPRRKKNWSQVPDGRLAPGQTGRLTVGRKLTLSLSLTWVIE